MLSKDRVDSFIREPLYAGLTRSEQMEMAAELLSLREQLAELKALPPFSWGLADKDGNAYLSECCIGDEGCMIDEAEAYNYELEPEHHIHAVPLFTAAKPNALPRHIYSMLVNELRDVPAIGCKRQLIIGVLNRHGVIAEPVGD